MTALVLLAARWVIAGIFVRSGLGKTAGLAEFRIAVANYELLPASLVAPVAYSLPFAEIVAGVLLALGVLPVVVAAALALMLAAFAAAIAVNLARGRVFDCGCAGSAATAQVIGWQHVLIDFVLAGAAAAVALAPPPANLFLGPGGLAKISMPGGGAFPVLLSVVLCLVMATLARRASAVFMLARGGASALPNPVTSRIEVR
jgi:uncharacterized membrane protein YphA (DoxX/SURF4 family)